MISLWQEKLQSRDEDVLIVLMQNNPGILNEKDTSGASYFSMLGYYRLSKARDAATYLKHDFDLYEAILTGQKELVKAILKKDETLLNSYSPDGFTPVALAAYFGKSEIAGILLEMGADPGIPASNPSKVNALHAAVAQNDLDLAKKILEKGIDVNSTQMQGVTALHSAAHRGSKEMVELLLEFGADKRQTTENGESAADFARKDSHENILPLLEQ